MRLSMIANVVTAIAACVIAFAVVLVAIDVRKIMWEMPYDCGNSTRPCVVVIRQFDGRPLEVKTVP
jgi:uncharacterized membrane protein